MPYIIGSQLEASEDGADTIFFDLRFVVIRKDTDTKIIFDLEAQKSYYPGYNIVTRGILYCSRILSAQVNTEFILPDYDGLKKVYSIWLCFNAPQYIGNAISRYRITKEDVLGNTNTPSEAYDKLEIVQICLQEDSYEHEDKLIGLLNTVFSTKKSFAEIENSMERVYNIPMNNKWGEEVRQMCNLSEGIEKKGIEKGVQQGIQQGIEKQKQEMYHTFSIMLENGTPLEQILKALDYPDDFKIWLSKQNTV